VCTVKNIIKLFISESVCKKIIHKNYIYTLSVQKKIILGFKTYPEKQIILPYLQSICACKNKLVQNMNKYGHLTFFINLSHNF